MKYINRRDIKPGMVVRAVKGKFSVEGPVVDSGVGRIRFSTTDYDVIGTSLGSGFDFFLIQDVEPPRGTIIKTSTGLHAINMFEEGTRGWRIVETGEVWQWSDFSDVEIIGGVQ